MSSSGVVTAIVLGASGRGKLYGDFAKENPGELSIVAIVEIVESKRKSYGDSYGIATDMRFGSWEEIFSREKFADAVIIATPDHLHYAPCRAAIDRGYDILLEKPMAQTEAECRDLVAYAHSSGSIVCLTHVLRYSPYFMQIKRVVDSGEIGDIVSIQHLEPVDVIHFCHSFVRGAWHDSRKSTPFVLAKASHDIDIIYYLLSGKRCTSVQAYGSLSHFKGEFAPDGSAQKCRDCKVESSCPFSAVEIYHRRREWLYVFDLPTDEPMRGEAILEQLDRSNYGDCVYRCANNQPDHYVMAMEFEGGVTCTLSIEAFTSYSGRRTRIMGTRGDIVGDMESFTVTDYLSRESRTVVPDIKDVENYKNSGHGGGDEGMIRDWISAIKQRDPSLMASPLGDSLESHLIAFAAENSRNTGNL